MNKDDKNIQKVIHMPSLAICILFYEKIDQTIECINSFLSTGINIYVINNGSTSSSRYKLGEFCNNYKQITIIDSDINLGVSVGRNCLISHTTEQWLLFIDNDIIIEDSNWVYKISKHISLHNDIEVFIPELFNVHENRYVSYRSFTIDDNIVTHDKEILNDLTNTFPGGASFINRKLFDRLGLYDDKMFVGFEDFEMSIRALLMGNPINCRLIHDIEMVHNHRQSANIEDKNALLTRYDKNRHEISFNRIIEKHNVILKSNWNIWIADQVEKPLKRRGPVINTNWVRLIPHPIKKVLKKLLNPRAVPTSCTLYMTDRCNLKCVGYNRDAMDIKSHRDMTSASVQELLLLYPSINEFCIAGLGEPTLCSNFNEIVDFLKINGKFVGIITNGTNSDKLQKLNFEPDYISISLKGYDNRSYLENAGIDVYNTVIETFSKLKLIYNNIGFSYILKKTNYRDLDKLLQICDTLKPDFLYLTNYLVYNPAIEEEINKIITVKDIEIIDYIEKTCANRYYIKSRPVYIDHNKPEFSCKSYNYVINLDGNGNIGGCQRQIPPAYYFGNIYTDTDPYNSLEMQKIRKQIHKKSIAHEECGFCFGKN